MHLGGRKVQSVTCMNSTKRFVRPPSRKGTVATPNGYWLQRRPDTWLEIDHMPIMVQFNKARAQYLLQCLAAGTPIQPAHEGWTGNDMLALAGACFFGASSQGPASFWCRDIPVDLHPEYQEAEEETFFNDLHAAVEFYGHLARLVEDGVYDDGHDQEVKVVVTQEGDVERTVRPISGMKTTGDAN